MRTMYIHNPARLSEPVERAYVKSRPMYGYPETIPRREHRPYKPPQAPKRPQPQRPKKVEIPPKKPSVPRPYGPTRVPAAPVDPAGPKYIAHPGNFGQRLPVIPHSAPNPLGGLAARAAGWIARRTVPFPVQVGIIILEEYWQPGLPVPGGYNFGSEWELKCSVPPRDYTAMTWSNSPSPITCNTGLAIFIPSGVFGDDIPGSATDVWFGYFNGAMTRMDFRESWKRLGGGADIPYETPAPTFIPTAPSPVIYPVDPLTDPIFQPQPLKKPIPYFAIPTRRENPDRSPLEQPQSKPQGTGQPSNRAPPYTPVGTPPGTGIPALEVIFPGGIPATGRPKVNIQPGWHRQRKPLRREREFKRYYGVNPGTPVGALVGALTEGADAIDAIHGALPPELQVKGGSPQAKLEAILGNLGEINIGKAIGNLIAEKLEDKALGIYSKLDAQAKQRAFEQFGNAGVRGPDFPSSRSPRIDLGSDFPDPVGDWLRDNLDIGQYY